MVILPLYQVIFATSSANFSKTDYFALMQDSRILSMDIPLNFPSYNATKQEICGISSTGEKDFVGIAPFKLSQISPEMVFTLSDRRILYPSLSQDNQKIALVDQEIGQESGTLRIILKEEFGWFPIQIKTDAALSNVCWGQADVVIYTAADGSLMMTTSSKPFRKAKLSDEGRLPAYHHASKRLAFIKGDKIVVMGDQPSETNVGNVSSLRFTNDGNALLFSTVEDSHYFIKKLELLTKEISHITEAHAPVVFAAEI